LSAGLNCDVLIHEATMEDDLVEDAFEKKHRFDIIVFLFAYSFLTSYLVQNVTHLHRTGTA